jgi:hypothetical protein
MDTEAARCSTCPAGHLVLKEAEIWLRLLRLLLLLLP